MSSPVSTTGGPAPDARDKLAALVRDFDPNSGSHSMLIREMVRQDRRAFYASALEILAGQVESRGSLFLVSTLAENDLLLPALSDLTLTREQAMALARAATLAGQMVDVAVARHLSENVESIGGGVCQPEIQRLMDILSEISDGTRILPSLMALARQPNPYLQSKAVLMIGRINRNVKWVLNRLGDPDARVRANAIEALWGVDTSEARHVLRGAARDGNNRVAGNALIALYRLGDCWSIPELMEMAGHESPRFRATAAWVMGQTGDPRFTRLLAGMVGEPNLAVRTPAFTALGLIKAATAAARQAGEWRVLGAFRRLRKAGWREIQVEVCSNDGRQRVNVLPTQFILSEDRQGVMSYTVEERQAPAILAVAFLSPRTEAPRAAPSSQGALRALAWKRPADLWFVVPYLDTADADMHATLLDRKIAVPVDRAGNDLPLQFMDDPKLAAEAFWNVPSAMDCSDLWSSIRRSVQVDAGQARGQHHLIVYSEREAAQPSRYPELVSAAVTSHTTVHAISLTPNPSLDNLCQSTKGTFRMAASSSEVPDCVEQAYLQLLARYTIRYQSAGAGASSLAIKVQSQAGWGETSVPIPP